MKTFLKFKTVSVTKAGDYCQIMFHDDLDTDSFANLKLTPKRTKRQPKIAPPEWSSGKKDCKKHQSYDWRQKGECSRWINTATYGQHIGFMAKP